jgi:hypothetical protein
MTYVHHEPGTFCVILPFFGLCMQRRHFVVLRALFVLRTLLLQAYGTRTSKQTTGGPLITAKATDPTTEGIHS